MTMIDTMSTQNSIYNPECKPLEEVKIKTLINGQYIDVPALDKHWVVEGREFTLYTPPPSEEAGPGAKEAWIERMGYLIDDFKWLLHLEHHRFWSQIALDSRRTVAGVEHLWQEAHPIYALDSFCGTRDAQLMQLYQQALHLAFLLFSRLVTQKESEREWIRRETLATLWYDRYIITLPMMFDLCMTYGDANSKLLTNMFKTVFDIQPLYKEDLKNAVCFIGDRLSLLQDKLKTRKVAYQHHPTRLVDQNGGGGGADLNESGLADLIVYLLDTLLNLATFMFIYQPACSILHSLRFESKIVSFYEHTIPTINDQLTHMFKKDDTIDIYFDLKYKLDVCRVQLIKIFRYCLFSPINSMIELTSIRSKNADKIKPHIEDFISTLSEFLADKLFIQDYHKAHPVDQDLEILTQVYPELDSVKSDFLMESVWSCYDVPPLHPQPAASSQQNGAHAQQQYLGPSNSSKTDSVRKPNSVELQSLVTQVKDLLPHLGDGFVQKCLEHYKYDSATVINAVLEDNIADSLRSLDFEMPAEPQPAGGSENTSNLPLRVNVFDNDEFDIMTRDSIDMSRVHKGKRKMKYKSLNEMLDDKSHIAELKEQFSRLGMVEATDEDVYDDEYDDTYDGLQVSVEEAGEPERRQFVTPRVLENRSGRGRRGGGGGGEEEDGEDDEEGGDYFEEDGAGGSSSRANRDNFVENPELVRARLERQRQNKYRSRGGSGGPPASSRDVTGKPKGQGQEKRVLENRDRKNTGKAYVGNHNRRNMAQRKRNQGMMPS